MIGVYEPNRPGFPWGFVLPLGAGVLARRRRGNDVVLAPPRRARSSSSPTPRASSAPATSTARAKLARDDELGDVGTRVRRHGRAHVALISSQRQLMADVSHELRTPLARIRVALELAAEDPVAAKDVLADVGGDLDEIDQLIEDILTTARLDAEQRSCHARADRASASSPTRAASGSRRATPAACSSARSTTATRAIECDPVLLRRALDNLLDNAAKYSDAGRREARGPRRTATTVAFEIVDQGIGMTRRRARARVHAVLARRWQPRAQDRRRGSRARARAPDRACARRRRDARIGPGPRHDRAPRNSAVEVGVS